MALNDQSFLSCNVSGDAEIDEALGKLLEDSGTKGINAAMRKATRAAVKEIVLPEVKSLIPYQFGLLESRLVVRAVTRSRSKVGYFVGFPDPLFKGETFYGGFIEFGWNHRLGVKVEADSYLRRALYPNADKVIAKVHTYLRDWIEEANNKAIPE
jgi:hypothetical protein